jgi:hypothetical protein
LTPSGADVSVEQRETQPKCMVTRIGGWRMPGKAALASSNSNKPFFFWCRACLPMDVRESETMYLLLLDNNNWTYSLLRSCTRHLYVYDDGLFQNRFPGPKRC